MHVVKVKSCKTVSKSLKQTEIIFKHEFICVHKYNNK